MASLEKRGDTYRIVFRFRGIKYSRALDTRNERDAEASRKRVEANLYDLETGRLIAPQGVDLLSLLLGDGRAPQRPEAVAVEPKRAEELTLAALFEAYFAKLPDGSLEASTIQSMKIHQRQLEKCFRKHFPIRSLTLTDLQDYVEKRSRDEGRNGRKVTAVTIKKAIVTLRTVWNWGRHHGLIEKPYPSKGLKYPKSREKPPFMTYAEVERRVKKLGPAEAADLWECVFLTLAEIDALLAVVKERARQPFIYPMFVFAAHTGARRSEILRSVVDDLDFDANLITIHERKKSHDKRTTRQVPMSPLLRSVLQEWLAQHPGGDHTFCQKLVVIRSRKHRDAIQPLSVNEAHDHLRRTLTGSKWEKLHGWHVFRHSFCSNCAAKGIDQRVIDAWVGHLSPDMVRRYRHLLPDQQQTAINAVFGDGLSGRSVAVSSDVARSA